MAGAFPNPWAAEAADAAEAAGEGADDGAVDIGEDAVGAGSGEGEDDRGGGAALDGGAPADGAPAGAAGDGALWAAATAVGDRGGEVLRVLEDRRRDLKRQRDQVNRDLRNAERRRARLLERARGLTDADLIGLLGARAAAKAKPKAAPKAKAKAKAKGKADPSA